MLLRTARPSVWVNLNIDPAGLAEGMLVDYYGLLGVAPTATREEVKAAYLKLARKFHPDLNHNSKESEERFKDLNLAYQVLVDPQQRRDYDQQRAAALGGGPGQENVGWSTPESAGGKAQGKSGGPTLSPNDIVYDVTITLEEAAIGVTRDLQVPSWVSCYQCGGLGSADGTTAAACQACAGLGQIQQVENRGGQRVNNLSPCTRCRGIGRLTTNPCTVCKGRGKVTQHQVMTVSIPQGVHDGVALEVPMHGNPMQPGGRMFVRVSIPAHPKFKRDGTDVRSKLSIPFSMAAMGGEVDVPTLQGVSRLSVPQGTDGGTVFRIKGKGMPDPYGGSHGDHLVAVRIEVPTDLTEEQRQLLREYARARGEPLPEARPPGWKGSGLGGRWR